MFTKFFKKNQDNSDIFKKLIHRLSDMPDQNHEKIDRLLDIISTPDQESEQLKTELTYREGTLDDTLKKAKNQLHKEQLEKNLERFRKNHDLPAGCSNQTSKTAQQSGFCLFCLFFLQHPSSNGMSNARFVIRFGDVFGDFFEFWVSVFHNNWVTYDFEHGTVIFFVSDSHGFIFGQS